MFGTHGVADVEMSAVEPDRRAVEPDRQAGIVIFFIFSRNWLKVQESPSQNNLAGPCPAVGYT